MNERPSPNLPAPRSKPSKRLADLIPTSLSALLLASTAAITSTATFATPASAQDTLGVGAHFSCAIRDRQAYCWGDNSDGQLGDGTRTARATPAPVRGLSDVVEVGAGENHACARTGAGEVYCWGNNRHGQIDGRPGPDVTGAARVAAIRDATSIAVGGFHTCAVHGPRGQVTCWGSNSHQQSGGRNDGGPARIGGASRVEGLWAGMYHNCAATRRGLMCWGDNSYGQLGTGNFRDSRRPRPARDLPRDVTAVALGRQHSCAIAEGQLYCWGYEPFDEGDAHDPIFAVPRVSTRFGSGLTGIYAGGNTTCARHQDGTLSCRGENAHGETGDGTTMPHPTPQRVPRLTAAREVVVGSMHICARDGAGAVLCWGDDSAHQTGRRTPTWTEAPVEVAPPTGKTFRALSVDGKQTCASTTDGTALCWGLDAAGVQVGHHHRVFGVRDRPTPIESVAGATVAISGGTDGCVLGGQGSVACWGGNLGRTPDNRPVGRGAQRVPFPNASSLAVAGGTACIVDAAGAVHCLGNNPHGLRGNASTQFSLTPSRVALPFAAQSVSGGGHTMCALGRGGELACWGHGDSGQRGNGTTNSGATPSRVEGPPTWAGVDVGFHHGCGVLPNGQVYCWGRGTEGQLGNGGQSSYVAPVVVDHLDTASQVSVGLKHSCARARNGSVWCWGLGDHGQLGHGDRHTYAAPVVVQGLANAREVHCGDDHTCAITEENRIFCWGNGRDGQLGNGVSHLVWSPTPVQF